MKSVRQAFDREMSRASRSERLMARAILGWRMVEDEKKRVGYPKVPMHKTVEAAWNGRKQVLDLRDTPFFCEACHQMHGLK